MHSLSDRARRIRHEMVSRRRFLYPPLSEVAVLQFESRWDVRLPAEYRCFLLEVGNGGTGPPDYGLKRLGEVPDDYWRAAPDVLRTLSTPFPLTQAWIWEGEEEDEKPHLQDAIKNGKLVLGTDGCGMYWVLIVTGPERGNVWFESGEGVAPCRPSRDFLSWYEFWLACGKDWWADLESADHP